MHPIGTHVRIRVGVGVETESCYAVENETLCGSLPSMGSGMLDDLLLVAGSQVLRRQMALGIPQ